MRKQILLSVVAFFMLSGCAIAAQHDYNIANAPGAVVRADINSVLSAVATNNSAATEPASTFANQWWFDTSTNIMKQRDNANSTWINVALKNGNGWTPYRQGSQIGTGALLTTDTDAALAADSDSNVPTQKAVKSYADAVQTSADTKISKTIAGEIAVIPEKTIPADADLILIEDSEAGNAKKRIQKSNLIAPVLSNVIFSWAGNESAGSGGGGWGFVATGTNNKPAATLGTVAVFMSNAATFHTILNFQFTKIAGISTITIHARLYTFDSASNSVIEVDIGGQNNSVQRSPTTPGWATTSDIDVSGLTDGTTYDGIIQHKVTGTQNPTYCSAVILIGS